MAIEKEVDFDTNADRPTIASNCQQVRRAIEREHISARKSVSAGNTLSASRRPTIWNPLVPLHNTVAADVVCGDTAIIDRAARITYFPEHPWLCAAVIRGKGCYRILVEVN